MGHDSITKSTFILFEKYPFAMKGSEVDPGTVPTGIKTFTAQANGGKVDVYSIYGVLVRSKVNPETALEGLPNGVYVVGGKKVVVGK